MIDDVQPPSQVGGIDRRPQHRRLPPHGTPTAAPGTTWPNKSPTHSNVVAKTVRNGREHGLRADIDVQPPSQVGGTPPPAQHRRLRPHDTPTAALGTGSCNHGQNALGFGLPWPQKHMGFGLPWAKLSWVCATAGKNTPGLGLPWAKLSWVWATAGKNTPGLGLQWAKIGWVWATIGKKSPAGLGNHG